MDSHVTSITLTRLSIALRIASIMGILLLTAGLQSGHALLVSGMTILVDQDLEERSSQGLGSEDASKSPPQEPSGVTKSIPGKDLSGSEELGEIRNQGLEQFHESVIEEERLMLETVQVLDRESAVRWLSGFLSSPPLNCPEDQRAEWIDAVIYATERNNLPICKEILALTACIIAIESGFSEDPPAVDPSSGRDMSDMLERAEEQLVEHAGSLLSVPPLPSLYQRYKERYAPKLIGCKTEGQVEKIARSIASDLKKDAEKLPEFMKGPVYEGIDRLANIIKTKGAMQLNVNRARAVMIDRGELFGDQELSDYMYTKRGGVDVGVAALKPMFIQYSARYATPESLSWLFFVGMDYHYGPFSSRNMMEQIRIKDLSGQDIPLDGDFLHYDESGIPMRRGSQTLDAARRIFPSYGRNWVFDAFLLEKDPHYIYTDLHASIARTHKERFGETPFAVIGDLWMGREALIKHGMVWRTRNYLKKLDRYLNSVPWDN